MLGDLPIHDDLVGQRLAKAEMLLAVKVKERQRIGHAGDRETGELTKARRRPIGARDAAGKRNRMRDALRKIADRLDNGRNIMSVVKFDLDSEPTDAELKMIVQAKKDSLEIS